ncbi:two-component system, NarL family, sensor histidine kinase EvgS [Vibrio crassostreae]|uniref:histidine kinase n=3 Tax=Vibrio crassostreae TaxID=246167 RepID=A0A822N4N7_9VIBR|nr:transporter substrate-binding domain-containing protein [Vibrio crassostreae]MDH5949766.1 transporter substrate-binding domain-containing protein [Vibrio crassostreae]TCN08325.1 two-component system sensor histidine kinase EvgS [Vibrio crassostreae]TCT77487.1 two-component system sensor histidine kinase EvgS [Vibrio crassostreae]TCU09525.1 two-component system sensor histidine kinase EvgS [Vibrio crassostreae]CAK2160720.1 two-component system, NarL family, sensor histidine kinase EvgS [Vibr
MKNIINCIALILISISSSFASDELVTQEQLQYLQTKKTIVIAKPTYLYKRVWEDLTINKNHRSESEIVQLLEQKLGIDIVVKDYVSSRALHEAIKNGEADLTFGYAQTKERDKHFAFSNSLYDIPNVYWYRDENTQNTPKKELTWACIRNSMFCQVIKDQGNSKVIFVNNTPELITALSVGNADATVLDLTSIQSYYSVVTPGEWQGNLEYSREIPSFSIQIMMRKEDKQLKSIVDRVLISKAEDIALRYSDYFFHFYDDLINQVLEGEYDRQTIRYTVSENIYPYSYLDPASKKTVGFIHDAIALISRKLGVSFEYIPPDGKDIVDMLRNREVEFLPGFDVEQPNNQEFQFSQPFMTLDWAYTEANKPWDVKRTAILDRTGYFIQKDSLNTDLADAVLYQDIDSLINDMSNGKITHAYIPQSIANLYVYNRYGNIFHIIASDESISLSRKMGVILRKDSTFLQNVINSAVSLTTQNEIDLLTLKHHNITAQYGYSKERIIAYTLMISCVVFALIIFGLVRTRRLSLSLSRAQQSEQRSYDQIQWLTTLLDNLPSLIAIHDKSGQLVLSNSAFDKQMAHCFTQQHDENPEFCWLRDNDEKTRNKLGVWSTIKCDCSGGEQHFRVIRQCLANASEKDPYVITVLDDLTRWEKQQRELEVSNKKAQEAIKARDLFLAIVSHELRTPIAAMIGLMELLSTKIENKDDMELLSNAQLSAERLKLLVSDILDISKMEANQLHLESKTSNIYDELCPIFRTFESNARLNNLNFKLDWKVDSISRASLDWLRVTQILNNLLNNAIKFTENGFVLVTVKTSSEQLQLSITDTGCGMSDQQIARAFQPFAQGDRSISRRYGGTGLGITVVQRLVNMMDGDLKIESKLGLGTKVSVSLPIKGTASPVKVVTPMHSEDREILAWFKAWKVENQMNDCSQAIERSTQWQNLYPDLLLSDITAQGKSVVHAPASEYHFTGTVLIADDDPINRLLFAKQLKRFGLKTVIVKDGQEAMEELENSETLVDIIITDCHMPNKDGYQLTEKIRSLDKLKHLPIIGCTAEDSKLVIEKAERVGMDQVLYKPYSFEELAFALEQLLPQQKTETIQADQSWAQQYNPDEQLQMATVILDSFSSDKAMLLESNPNVKAIAHRIKGAASLLGLESLNHAAKDCEKNAENPMYCHKLIEELDLAIASAQAVIKQLDSL